MLTRFSFLVYIACVMDMVDVCMYDSILSSTLQLIYPSRVIICVQYNFLYRLYVGTSLDIISIILPVITDTNAVVCQFFNTHFYGKGSIAP